MNEEEARAACAVLDAPHGGPAALAYLRGCDDAHPTPPGTWEAFLAGAAPPRDPAPLPPFLHRVRAQWNAMRRDAESVAGSRRVHRLRELGARCIAVDDADYPAPLRAIAHRPAVLFVRGPAALAAAPGIAIVGTRRASEYGKDVARLLASDLASAGVVVISGLARGVDASAHRGALEAGGTTIAVLGTGVDICFPVENRALHRTIGETGALVSEYLPGTEGRPHHFPARNRLVSGLARGVVVVEAAFKSGALVTARYALDQNREVCAVPGDIHAPGSAGPHDLLRHGAALVERAEDVAEACGLTWRRVEADGLHAGEAAIPEPLASHLTVRPRSLDDLARATAMPASALSGLLERLALTGTVERDPAGRYARPRRRSRQG